MSGINQNSYLIGPRIAPYTFHKFTPYGKALVGCGSGSFLTGHTVCHRLRRRRGLPADPPLHAARGDFEYQQWHVTPTTSTPTAAVWA